MKKISKRIRSAAGKVMSSKDGYEVRDAIASALVMWRTLWKIMKDLS